MKTGKWHPRQSYKYDKWQKTGKDTGRLGGNTPPEMLRERMKIKMRMLDHFMKHLEHPRVPRQGAQKLILQGAVALQRFHSRGNAISCFRFINSAGKTAWNRRDQNPKSLSNSQIFKSRGSFAFKKIIVDLLQRTLFMWTITIDILHIGN